MSEEPKPSLGSRIKSARAARLQECLDRREQMESLVDGQNVKKIPLTKGLFCIVDSVDYEELSKFKWYYNSGGYAARSISKPRKQIIYMHRQIVGTDSALDTDHRNSNGLDNRRSNLRACTTSQNLMNRRIASNNKTGFKGVSYCKKDKRFCAFAVVGGKHKYLGGFLSPESASAAYQKSVLTTYGEFARV